MPITLKKSPLNLVRCRNWNQLNLANSECPGDNSDQETKNNLAKEEEIGNSSFVQRNCQDIERCSDHSKERSRIGHLATNSCEISKTNSHSDEPEQGHGEGTGNFRDQIESGVLEGKESAQEPKDQSSTAQDPRNSLRQFRTLARCEGGRCEVATQEVESKLVADLSGRSLTRCRQEYECIICLQAPVPAHCSTFSAFRHN